jgi:hypothetical protein
MSAHAQIASKAHAGVAPSTTTGVVRRKCACGGTPGPTGECAACLRKRPLGGTLQSKLRLNEPGDRYEQEADGVAEHVMRMREPGPQRTPT